MASSYPVIINRHEEEIGQPYWVAYSPALQSGLVQPNLFSCGDTIQEAYDELMALNESVLDWQYREKGFPLPVCNDGWALNITVDWRSG